MESAVRPAIRVDLAFMTESSMSCPFVGSRAVRGSMPLVMGIRATLGKISAALGENVSLISDNLFQISGLG